MNWLLERENPRTLFGINLATYRGLLSNLNNLRIAANGCHCNAGGYMTFKQAFWLAVLTSIIGPIVVALIRYFFSF